MAERKEELIDGIGDASSQLKTALNRYRALTFPAITTARGSGHAAISGHVMLQQKVPGTPFSPPTPGMTTLTPLSRSTVGSTFVSHVERNMMNAKDKKKLLESIKEGLPKGQGYQMGSLEDGVKVEISGVTISQSVLLAVDILSINENLKSN